MQPPSPRRPSMACMATMALPLGVLLLLGTCFGSTLTDTENVEHIRQERVRRDASVGSEQARAWNLATKVMSNGVEVIVATDKSTLPGEPEVLRVLPSSPITLAPSTLTDHMMLLMPSQVELDSAQFVTRTYVTTYTLVETSTSKEQVVSNVATEQLSPAGATSTPLSSVGVTVTASPVLSTAVYHTTYTYLNTLLDGEVPLVLTSRKTVANTVTAPGEVLASHASTRDTFSTNTYLSTVQLTRTLSDGDQLKVVSTQDVLTQVVITESQQQAQVVTAPPSTPTELDIAPTTTEVVKTYLVTYTYYSTFLEDERTVVRSEVAVSTDITTETFLKKPKRTSALRLETTTPLVEPTPVPPEAEATPAASPTPRPEEPAGPSLPALHVVATKTYLTTFTYFTTLLQGATPAVSTVVSSRTRVVQNVVTETVPTSLLHPDYVQRLRSSFRADPSLDTSRIVATATLQGGQQMEITAMVDSPANLAALYASSGSVSGSAPADEADKAEAVATPALSPDVSSALNAAVSSAASAIMGQSMASAAVNRGGSSPVLPAPSSAINDKVITGSTIIFFDDQDEEKASVPSSSSSAVKHKTPSDKPSRPQRPPSKTHKHKVKPATAVKEKPSATAALGNTYRTSILSSKTVSAAGATLLPGEQVVVLSRPDGSEAVIPVNPSSASEHQATNKRPSGEKVGEAAEQGSNLGMSELLQLGSIGINGINALRPVFSAMAGLLSPAKEEAQASKPVLVVHKMPPGLPHGPPPGLLGPPPGPAPGLQLAHFQKPPPPAPLSAPVLQPTSPAPVLEQNPLLSYAGPQPPQPPPPERLVAAGSSSNPQRNPIYIPVGAGAGAGKDSVAEESQRVEGHVKLNAVWPDAEQRLKLAQEGNGGVVLGRPTLESPLLAGGIPIQPGQVITANSDVIIGKPSVHGPRPPKRPASVGDHTPIGMKPPPPPPPPQATWPEHDRLPEDTVEHEDLDQPVPAASSVGEPHDQIDDHIANLLPPPAPPATPLREERPSGGPAIPIGIPHHHKHHEILDMSPPANQPAVVHSPNQDVPLRPPPPPPQLQQHHLHLQHQQHLQHHIQQHPQHQQHQQLHPEPQPQQDAVGPLLTVVGSHSLAPLGLGDFGDFGPTQVSVVPQGQTVFLGRPVSQKMNVDQQHLTPDTITVPIILPGNPQVVERASGQPLLVNIQPSQVANVLIPHGSSTALIYSGDTLEHGKRGEYFDDPLPYPDPDPSASHAAHAGVDPTGVPKPSSAIRMDVPIPPEGIQVQISAGNAVQGPSVQGPSVQGPPPPGRAPFPAPAHGPSIPLHNEVQVGAPLYHGHHHHHHQEQPAPRPPQHIGDEGDLLVPPPPPPPSQQQHHHHHNQPNAYVNEVPHRGGFEEPPLSQQHQVQHHLHQQQVQHEQQLQHEQKLREQQIHEQKLREQIHEQKVREQIHEQKLREQQIHEQKLREQQIQEQKLREQHIHEQKIREQIHEQKVREQIQEQKIREQIHEQNLREQQIHEQKVREQQIQEQKIRDQQIHEQKVREQIHEQKVREQIHEQKMKEQQLLREQQIHEQHLREQQLQQQLLHQIQQQPSSPVPAPPRAPGGLDEPVDYMVPPPVPSGRPQGRPPGRPQPQAQPTPPGPPAPDSDGDDQDEPIESEGGELIQESNARPLRPGQVPIELEVANQAKTTERPVIPHLHPHHGHGQGHHSHAPRPQEPFRFERPGPGQGPVQVPIQLPPIQVPIQVPVQVPVERPSTKPVNFDIESPIKSTIIFEQRPDNKLEPIDASPIPINLPPLPQHSVEVAPPKPDVAHYGDTPPPPPPSTPTFQVPHKPVKGRPDRRPTTAGDRDRTSHDDQVLGMAPPTPPPSAPPAGPPSTTTGRPHRRPPLRKRPPPPYKFEMPPPPADTMQPPTEPPQTSARPSAPPAQPAAPSAAPAEGRPFNRPPVLEMAKPLPTITLPGSQPGSQPGETVQHAVTWEAPKRYTTTTTTTPSTTTSSSTTTSAPIAPPPSTRRPPSPFIRPLRPFGKPSRQPARGDSASPAASPAIAPTPPQLAATTPLSPLQSPQDIAPTTTRGRPTPSNRWTASPAVDSVASSEPAVPGVVPSSIATPLASFSGKSSQAPSTPPTRVYLTRHHGSTNRFTRPTTTERFTPSPTRDTNSHTRYASPPYRAPPRRPQPGDDAPPPQRPAEDAPRRPAFSDASPPAAAPAPSTAASPAPQPTRFITHTETLVLTTTETTVVRGSEGQVPSTQTVVLTSTTTSTRVDTVTETETLVKPTSVFETVTTTVSHTTTHTHTHTAEPPVLPTVYPPWAVSPTPYPEHDTIDVHVSSSASGHPEGSDDDDDIITHQEDGEDSIFLVMTDQKPGTVEVHKVPPHSVDDEPTNADETNEVKNNAVLLGGVLVASPPAVRPAGGTGHDVDEAEAVDGDAEAEMMAVQCVPECSPARNELCQRIMGIMRCVCRPGFARMFPDQPCKPTYTYSMRLALDRHGGERVRFADWLSDPASPRFARLAEATKEGLERVVMQSELRDVAHGVVLQGFAPAGQHDDEHAVVNFYVQLSDNTDEVRLKDVFRKSLRATNFSLGGTEVFAAREMLPELDAADFDECEAGLAVGAPRFHDCSEHARCFNLRGTYTCSCKEGYADVSDNPQFPGRTCSPVGCEQCHYHGTCYSRGPNERPVCECFQWYTGQHCHINLKVLLIALGTVGGGLLLLLVVCCVMTCARRRQRRPSRPQPQQGFLRYRGPSHRDHDTRAMIHDTSSEGSVDNSPLPPYVTAMHQPMHTMSAKPKKTGMKKVSVPHGAHGSHADAAMVVERTDRGSVGLGSPVGTMEQRDRSLTVMIPRAKYRAAAPMSPQAHGATMSTFTGEPDPQHKLLAYLDSPTPVHMAQAVPQAAPQTAVHSQGSAQAAPQQGHGHGGLGLGQHGAPQSRKQSGTSAVSAPPPPPAPSHRKGPAPRKPSSTGALVSAGFEVSATVGRPARHALDADDDASSRDDVSRDDVSSHHQHYHHDHHHDHRFDTQRTRVGDSVAPHGCPEDQLAARLADLTVSEARSCDETTIQPPTRCIHSHVSNYASSKPSSHSNHNNNDESHTMVERDLGSTFLMPQTHLYQPDRGSDISNFDSL